MITRSHFASLVDTPENVNNVVAFKVKQGIEFIARVCGSDTWEGSDDTVELEKIRLMDIQVDNHGQMVGRLVPYSNSNNDTNMVFSLSDVAAVYTPCSDVERDYIQSTTAINLTGV